MASQEPAGASTEMRRSYVMVVVIWIITLAALFIFPKLFA
jgi:hypothetical protein